jgi:hypothetical protein
MKKAIFVVLAVLLFSNVGLFSQDDGSLNLNEPYSYLVYWKSRNIKPNDDEIKSFLYVIDYDNYIQKMHNEISFMRYLNDMKPQVEELLESVDLNSTFTVMGNVGISKYDFKREGFDITMGQGIQFSIGTPGRNRNISVSLVFENNKDFNVLLKKNLDEAESMINKMGGDSNPCRFYFKFRMLTDNERKNLKQGEVNFTLYAKLERIVLFGFMRGFEKEVLGIINMK